MSIPGWIICGCLAVFYLFWFISAQRIKPAVERKSWSSSLAYRLPVVLGIILIFDWHLPAPLNLMVIPHSDWIRYGGAMVCVGGLAVAIWARVTLAGNWSSNVTFKQGHELIRTGPYRYVRHPIYTGILLMGLGIALDIGVLRCWLGIALQVIGFWIKLKQEETLMLQHFPDQYPAYRKEVKALVPFLF